MDSTKKKIGHWERATENRIFISKTSPYKMQPDARTFPVFCDACKKVQSELFIYRGSRYGYLGSGKCEYCKYDLHITDGDRIVVSARINGREIWFKDLYLLDWKYIEMMGQQKADIIDSILEDGFYLSVNQLCDEIETALKLEHYQVHTYVTDEDFSLLPEDINRWISLLEAVGVELPENAKKV